VTHAYSVSGTPVVETLATCARMNIRPIGVRHEQAAALAAVAQNYVSGRPAAVAILASGPAVTNAATGILVAKENQWPLVVLGGRSSTAMDGMGAFQELNAVPVFRPITKWSTVVESTERIPDVLAEAIQVSMKGVPGPVYIDLPADILAGTTTRARPCEQRAVSGSSATADPEALRQAAGLLLEAERPLLILGEGVRWSEPYRELRRLVEVVDLPFISSPMGRGYLPDDHPRHFGYVRTLIQRTADVVLLVGSRLNWIFRFGKELSEHAKIVQFALQEDEVDWNRRSTVSIVGDFKQTLRGLLAELDAAGPAPSSSDSRTLWFRELTERSAENKRALEPSLQSDAVPVTPHRLMKEIRDFVPRASILVADGNVTLEAARQVLPTYSPSSRLNCGNFGCIGVGIPFGIGAKLARPDRMVLCICGDSAFGFCAMEMETAVRNRVPLIVVVANNDGIGGNRIQAAHYPIDYSERVTTYTPNLHYERIMGVFGGHTEYVERPDEVRRALERAAASGTAACINVRLDPTGQS
jgi:thiamine pyrophosphate-dependent acetolactate synthase large subunit-like protein